MDPEMHTPPNEFPEENERAAVMGSEEEAASVNGSNNVVPMPSSSSRASEEKSGSSLKRGLRRTAEELDQKQRGRQPSATTSHATVSAPIVKGGLRRLSQRPDTKRNSNRPGATSTVTVSAPIVKGGLRRPPKQERALRLSAGAMLPLETERESEPQGCAHSIHLEQTDSEEVGEFSSVEEAADGIQGHSPSVYLSHSTDEITRESDRQMEEIVDPVVRGEHGVEEAEREEEEGNCGLVQARPVENDESSLHLQLPEAELVDLEAAEHSRKLRQERQRRTRFLVFGFALFVFAAAVALGVLLTRREKDSNNTLSSLRNNSTNNFSLTASPTLSPTMSPLNVLLDSVRDSLPNFTLVSLSDPSSPQLLAWNWMQEYPNLVEVEPWRIKQLFALASFYFSFDGPNWPNGLHMDWLDRTKSECAWFSSLFGDFNIGSQVFSEETLNLGDNSFTETWSFPPCDDNTGRFVHLELERSLLFTGDQNPRLPPELVLLTDLQIISLELNRISALLEHFIPPQLMQLSSLHTVNLDFNNLHGTIPIYMFSHGWSPNWLTLVNNALEGALPSELGFFGVKQLVLSNNYFEGTLPTFLGDMSSLLSLSLDQNFFTGSLPTELGRLSDLFWLDLNDCYFSGILPSQLGLLTKMVHLELQGNHFEGALPSELFLLTELELLSLDSSLLRNAFPMNELQSKLVNLKNFSIVVGGEADMFGKPFPVDFFNDMAEFITSVDLSNQGLIGTIPTEIGLLSNCQALLLSSNEMTGPIPTEIGLVTALRTLDLTSNYLTGTLPSEIGQALSGQEDLLSLFFLELRLAQNSLSGRLPTELGLCTGLHVLDLHDNLFSSTIPSELGLLSALYYLELDYNALTGTLPEFGWIQPFDISVSHNQISGTIPTSLSAPGLDLAHNQITGRIPSEFGALDRMVLLNLDNNQLTGQIPSELGLLTGAEGFPVVRISLENNTLAGRIPTELATLAGLYLELNITGNPLLSGTMPADLCYLQQEDCTYSIWTSGIRQCHLNFDCTELLCGCDCPCL